MLFFIEVGLGVLANRRGWKAWAALPIAIGLLCGVVLGILVINNEISKETMYLAAFSVDGLVMLTLGVMCATGGPYKKKAKPDPKDKSPAAPVREGSGDYRMVSR